MVVNQMLVPSPLISVDVDSFGLESASKVVIARAGAGNQEALTAIVDTATWLTNGHFPSNYDIGAIFLDRGYIIPRGEYNEGNMSKDIRGITLSKVAKVTGDYGIAREWAVANSGVNGISSSLTNMVKLLSRIAPNATITGRAVRHTFNPLFINTLVASIQAAGISPFYNRLGDSVNITGLESLDVYGQNFNSFSAGNAGGVGGSYNLFHDPLSMGLGL